MHYFKNKKDELAKFTSYLYLVTLSNGKFYVGRHKCKVPNKIDISYICSSTNEDFWEVFLSDVGNQKIAILEVGTDSFITQREKDYLSEVDARKNKDYYNESNSSGGISSDINLGLVSRILGMIENGTYPSEYVNKTKLFNETEAWQVRRATNQDHISWLCERMKDAGNADDFPPVIVLDSVGNGKSKRLGGNHTLQAAQIAPGFNNISRIIIPKYTTGNLLGWSNLSEDTIRRLGLALNPEPKKKALPNSKIDIADTLIHSEQNSGLKIDSDINRLYLKEHLSLNGKQVDSYIKFAKDKKYDDDFNQDYNFKSYSKLNIANEKFKREDLDKNIYVWDTGTGFFKLDQYVTFVQKIHQKLKHSKFTVVVLMHHSSPAVYNKTTTEKSNGMKKGLSAIKWLSKTIGYKSEVTTLQHKVKRKAIIAA